MKTRLRTCAQFFALILVSVTLAASGLAHQMPEDQTPALSTELAAYIASGGALSDICNYTSDTGEEATTKCDACRLIGAAVLPSTTACASVIFPDQTRALVFVATRLVRSQRPDRTRLTRAPPHA